LKYCGNASQEADFILPFYLIVMKIKVLAFGIARDICGGRELELDVPEVLDTDGLKSFLERLYPGLSAIKTYALAINQTYAAARQTIQEGDEIAIIPPVSGG
jgi:molybdopterin synthase sulfur carrier subunit